MKFVSTLEFNNVSCRHEYGNHQNWMRGMYMKANNYKSKGVLIGLVALAVSVAISVAGTENRLPIY